MRLAIVIHQAVKGDGHGRVNYEIARGALRQGHQVTLLAHEVAPDLKTVDGFTWVPISWGKVPSQLLKNLVFAWRVRQWLRQHRAELDIIHLNGSITWMRSDVNTSHFVHGAWLRSPVHAARLSRNLNGAYQWLFTYINTFWERRAYRETRAVVAVSEQVKQELTAIGVSDKRIQVILNGVDINEFHPAPVGCPVDRPALGLPPDKTLALFVGDIRTPRKNLDTVLRALVKTKDMELVVVGSTQNSPYPALAQQLGVASRVHFLGFRRDVPQLMRATDAFVFPSRYEACSLVLLEALASGLPIITARTAGGSEIVTPECGLVLDDPNNVEQLIQAMQQMMDQSQQRVAMGQAARAIAEKYSWDIMADKYLQLYRELGAA